jgi:hypothetical protein
MAVTAMGSPLGPFWGCFVFGRFFLSTALSLFDASVLPKEGFDAEMTDKLSLPLGKTALF